MKPYYQDEFVTLYHGDARNVLLTLERVDHFIADPPYSEHVHSAARSRVMSAREKPLTLMRQLVTQFTDPGEVILDPTAGSGTTGVAAKREGRRAILVERDEKHCESAALRLEAEQPQLIPVTPAATPLFDT